MSPTDVPNLHIPNPNHKYKEFSKLEEKNTEFESEMDEMAAALEEATEVCKRQGIKLKELQRNENRRESASESFASGTDDL